MDKRISRIGLLGLALCSLAASASAQVRYGAICNEDYSQWPSMDDMPGQYADCRKFLDNLDALGTERFYHGTRNGEMHFLERHSMFESRIEDLDLLLIAGHSGSWSTQGFDYPGVQINDVTYSKDWRLGDGDSDAGRASTQHGLSVLAIQGCSSLFPVPIEPGESPREVWGSVFPSDRTKLWSVAEDIMTRWGPAMRGGLRMIMGHWDNSFTSRTGELFGLYLTLGSTIRNAWIDAARSHSGNTPAVFTTGRTRDECYDRLYGMTAFNIDGQYRMYDSDHGSSSRWCATWAW